jgi:hypothetical protein
MKDDKTIQISYSDVYSDDLIVIKQLENDSSDGTKYDTLFIYMY